MLMMAYHHMQALFLLTTFATLSSLVTFKNLQIFTKVNQNNVARGSSLILQDSLILDGFASLLDKKSRPSHIGIPRKRMELQFAVLLMRSGYEIADELDFYPMDEFQKDFFLYRQSEWLDYKGYHPTVFQGDLADPLYFDFIRYISSMIIANGTPYIYIPW